jgi:putative flippase GtrA
LRPSRQFIAFAGVGLVAAVAHYGVLVALVETGAVAPVPATLAGYVVGGVVSYLLNRRNTYRSDRPHREATWRFAVVAAVGFFITWALMRLFVTYTDLPYLLAQVLTTGVVLLWSFVAHGAWTFGQQPRRR